VAEKEYLCGEKDCGQSFDKLSLLRAHIKEKHPTELKHICSECGKKYRRKKDLETHLGTHFPDQRKLFYCNEPDCAKSFISESNLRTHMRTAHTGDKQFVCTFRIPTKPTANETSTDKDCGDGMTECGKCFAFKHVLERHILTHSKPVKEKPAKKKIKTAAQEVAKIVGVVHYPSLPPPPATIPTPLSPAIPPSSSSSTATSPSFIPSLTVLPSSQPAASPTVVF
jgi:hypothetical protein